MLLTPSTLPFIALSSLLALGVLHCSLGAANAQSGGTQALTKEDLNRINNQPLAPSAKNPAGLGKKEERKPSFEHTEATGTRLRSNLRLEPTRCLLLKPFSRPLVHSKTIIC